METGEVLDLLAYRHKKQANAEAVALSTGSPVLDMALDGGYARGRIIELCGDVSAYKTTLAYYAVAEAQKLGPVLWMDTGELNVEHARRCGVDLRKLVIRGADSAVDVLSGMSIAAQEETFALMVLDCASLVDTSDWHGHEYLFDWLKQDCVRTGTPALFTTYYRYRSAIEAFPTALRKWASQRVVLRPKGRGYVEAEVAKNAIEPPHDFKIILRFDKAAQMDNAYSLVRLAIETGVIEQRGSWLDSEFARFHGIEEAVGFYRPEALMNDLRDTIEETLA